MAGELHFRSDLVRIKAIVIGLNTKENGTLIHFAPCFAITHIIDAGVSGLRNPVSASFFSQPCVFVRFFPLFWFVTSNYTVLTSAANPDGSGAAVSSVQREAAQALGRPYTRMAPPIGVFTNTFAEKTLDSR